MSEIPDLSALPPPAGVEAGTAHLPGLDLLRSLAVLMVLIFHFSSATGWQLFSTFGRLGWMGVDLFFVLSGYLIGSQLFREIAKARPLRLKRFFIRRALRTFPSFFAVVFVYFTVPPLREKAILPPLWKFVTFTQNFALDRFSQGAFSHAWSLCVEEQFYLALPLIVVLMFQRPNAKRVASVIFATLVFGITVRVGLWFWIVEPARNSAANFASYYDEFLYYPTFARLDGLLVGVGLALVKTFRPTVWRQWLSHPSWAFATFATLLSIAGFLNDRKFSFEGAAFLYPALTFSFGALLVLAVSPSCWWARKQVPGVSTLASLSYGIYLVQKLVFHWSELHLQSWFGVAPFSYLGFAVIVLFCGGIAFELSAVIEKPFLKLRDRVG